MLGHLAREVMVEIADRGASRQQSRHCVSVQIERNVQHRAFVARTDLDPIDESNVAFYPGDQNGSLLLCLHARQAQLLEGT